MYSFKFFLGIYLGNSSLPVVSSEIFISLFFRKFLRQFLQKFFHGFLHKLCWIFLLEFLHELLQKVSGDFFRDFALFLTVVPAEISPAIAFRWCSGSFFGFFGFFIKLYWNFFRDSLIYFREFLKNSFRDSFRHCFRNPFTNCSREFSSYLTEALSSSSTFTKNIPWLPWIFWKISHVFLQKFIRNRLGIIRKL